LENNGLGWFSRKRFFSTKKVPRYFPVCLTGAAQILRVADPSLRSGF